MSRSVLVTQCLQHDFVAPLAPDEPLPNKLHVGHAEARRLVGHDPARGPVAQLMGWAREGARDALSIVHIRDWHDPADPSQREHLATFGAHCVRGTPGARLVLGLEDGMTARERTVECIGLNDFEGTSLAAVVDELRRGAGTEPLRVAVVGVWTDAKVTFLLYDLKTRCGIDDLATCSALTASASRAQHFNALEQLRRLLGVRCFDSVGELCEWLDPSAGAPRLWTAHEEFGVRIEAPDDLTLDAVDRDLLGCLYRDSSRVELSSLSGGFSGARVLRARSHDSLGHAQAPSVAKLGPRALVGAERAAFERVEEILGNDAPAVRGFVDLGERAGIKYSFAAMGDGKVRTLKGLFASNAPEPQIVRVLSTALEDVLGRFYGVAQLERLPLLEHYRFSPSFAPSVRRNVTAIVGEQAAWPALRFEDGYEVRNLCSFYEEALPRLSPRTSESHYVSYVHGDLNGANILVDGRDNVWLIDFFHTARGHVLKDLAKLENDVLYLFTPISGEADLAGALAITRALRAARDLRDPLPVELSETSTDALRRAWNVVRWLRALAGRLCRDDTSGTQLSIALLRYAAHTLSFDEASALQKRWALAAACGHAEDVTAALS